MSRYDYGYAGYDYNIIKGYILSFDEYECLSPTFHSQFNFFGEPRQSIMEAYECLEKDTMSTSDKIHLMGDIMFAFFKQKPLVVNKLCSTEGYWIEPSVKDHDNFWFSCGCVECFDKEKPNYYGRLLMEIRDYLLWEQKPKQKKARGWKKHYL